MLSAKTTSSSSAKGIYQQQLLMLGFRGQILYIAEEINTSTQISVQINATYTQVVRGFIFAWYRFHRWIYIFIFLALTCSCWVKPFKGPHHPIIYRLVCIQNTVHIKGSNPTQKICSAKSIRLSVQIIPRPRIIFNSYLSSPCLSSSTSAKKYNVKILRNPETAAWDADYENQWLKSHLR